MHNGRFTDRAARRLDMVGKGFSSWRICSSVADGTVCRARWQSCRLCAGVGWKYRWSNWLRLWEVVPRIAREDCCCGHKSESRLSLAEAIKYSQVDVTIEPLLPCLFVNRGREDLLK